MVVDWTGIIFWFLCVVFVLTVLIYEARAKVRMGRFWKGVGLGLLAVSSFQFFSAVFSG